jgi:hypothetical protein
MGNGYVQMDILGRKRGLKFGMTAVHKIAMDAQKLGATIGENIDYEVVPVIVYWGLFNNCYVKREDPDFTFEDVVEWVDAHINQPELFTEVIKTFYESKAVQGNLPAGDEKKSSTSRPRKAGKS